MPPSHSSRASASRSEAPELDELAVQKALLFADSINGLKDMRSQLYSAAEYFELSYSNDEQKQIVMNTLKDYAIKALVNTVDHLGSISHKVKGFLNEEVEEVSDAETRVSCIEQRLRICCEHNDQEGRSQQSLLIRGPKYHKHYIVQGETTSKLGTVETTSKLGTESVPVYEVFNPPKENVKPKQVPAENRGRSSVSRTSRNTSRASSPSQRARSLSPIKKAASPPRSPQPRIVSYIAKREALPFPSNPIAHARSSTSSPLLFNSSKQYTLESQNSEKMFLPAERNDQKETEHNQTTKSRGFLKALLTRRRSRNDESLYIYLDEY